MELGVLAPAALFGARDDHRTAAAAAGPLALARTHLDGGKRAAALLVLPEASWTGSAEEAGLLELMCRAYTQLGRPQLAGRARLQPRSGCSAAELN
jgi:hypothetical protein